MCVFLFVALCVFMRFFACIYTYNCVCVCEREREREREREKERERVSVCGVCSCIIQNRSIIRKIIVSTSELFLCYIGIMLFRIENRYCYGLKIISEMTAKFSFPYHYWFLLSFKISYSLIIDFFPFLLFYFFFAAFFTCYRSKCFVVFFLFFFFVVYVILFIYPFFYLFIFLFIYFLHFDILESISYSITLGALKSFDLHSVGKFNGTLQRFGKFHRRNKMLVLHGCNVTDSHFKLLQ